MVLAEQPRPQPIETAWPDSIPPSEPESDLDSHLESRRQSLIDTMKGNSVQLLTNTRGQPWTKCGFKASWKKALKGPLAVIREQGLVFYGLRKSAVVMLLEAGASEAEVAAVTG
jgi:hypothetical protein